MISNFYLKIYKISLEKNLNYLWNNKRFWLNENKAIKPTKQNRLSTWGLAH